MAVAKELDDLLTHLIGGTLLSSKKRAEEPEEPLDLIPLDGRQNQPLELSPVDRPTSSPARNFMATIGLQPFIQSARLVQSMDPAKFALEHLPIPETTLGLAGTLLGAEVGGPPAAALGGGLGGGLGKAIELSRSSGGKLGPSAPREIGTAAGINAIFGGIGGMPLTKAREITSAARFGRQIGVLGTPTKSAVRLAVVDSIRNELATSPHRSGEILGERLSSLHTLFPERHAILGENFSQAVDSIRNLLSKNVGFHRALLKSADDLGKRDLVLGLLPELQVGFETGSGTEAGEVIGAARANFRKVLLQEMRNQGQLAQEIRPETSSLDQVQQFKQIVANIFGKNIGRPGARLMGTELDALEGYGAIREAELATHPELEEAFANHHQIMDQFRQVKKFLGDPDILEGALRTAFGGGSASQEAVKGLLADRPAALLTVENFANAAQFARTFSSIKRRMIAYGLLFPAYSLASLVRHELFTKRRR